MLSFPALRLLTPPMETPDPPSDTRGASKQAVLTPHDTPRSFREGPISENFQNIQAFELSRCQGVRAQ